MTEKIARHICLTVTGAAAIFVFLIQRAMILNWDLATIALSGRIATQTFVTLGVFLAFGALTVMSAFFKIPFYILAAFEVVLLLIIIERSGANAVVIILCMMMLVPQVFYWVLRVVKPIKSRTISAISPEDAAHSQR